MKNTGKAFESLTQEVFSRLLAQDNICVEVERDVVIPGKSTSHQIDVTFQFVVGTTKYRTIVQCKDWGSPVKQEQVLAFQSVLADIPGQPRGIMVSKSGYQKGARGVASHHGIELYELRAPRDEDWKGLIRTIELNITVRSPHIGDVRMVPDMGWIRREVAKRRIQGYSLQLRISSEGAPLTLESGAACDVGKILRTYLPTEGCGPVEVRHVFSEQVTVATSDSRIPRIPIEALEATIRVEESHKRAKLSLDHLIAYCFRDVLQEKSRFLDIDGNQVGGREI
jgi:hypothetical protein